MPEPATKPPMTPASGASQTRRWAVAACDLQGYVARFSHGSLADQNLRLPRILSASDSFTGAQHGYVRVMDDADRTEATLTAGEREQIESFLHDNRVEQGK